MVVVSSEESCSCPDDNDYDYELNLGLGLSVGGGNKFYSSRIMTAAQNFPSIVVANKASSSLSSVSSSSSSITFTTIAANNGTKRTAEDEPSSPPDRSVISQVIGWPPIRTYRAKAAKELCSTVDKCTSQNTIVDKTKFIGNSDDSFAKKASLFVKVKMDGIQIGRKVDLNAHSCYETLAHTLDDMFRPSAVGPNVEDQVIVAGTRRPVRFLDGSSDFVLTYEDREGDWMLVGDVPWEMFLSSVKRLRIMRTAEANGLASRSHEGNMSWLRR